MYLIKRCSERMCCASLVSKCKDIVYIIHASNFAQCTRAAFCSHVQHIHNHGMADITFCIYDHPFICKPGRSDVHETTIHRITFCCKCIQRIFLNDFFCCHICFSHMKHSFFVCQNFARSLCQTGQFLFRFLIADSIRKFCNLAHLYMNKSYTKLA